MGGVFIVMVVVVAIAVMARRSPEGYQDDSGFHYGRDPKDSTKRPQL